MGTTAELPFQDREGKCINSSEMEVRIKLSIGDPLTYAGVDGTSNSMCKVEIYKRGRKKIFSFLQRLPDL